MKISSIISEYNPLHNGHIYHINRTKAETNCDGLIIVISGNFVQRGEPSIVNKWKRTLSTLLSGGDLVIELPSIYAISSAEFFAFGAISLLNSLNVVNTISFGSEHGSTETLKKIAKTLNEEDTFFKKKLKLNISQGFSYPLSRNLALNSVLNIESLDDILNSSNNILAIEYLKTLDKLNSNISPFTIKRIGALYNSKDLTDKFQSATGIRNALKEKSNIDIDNFIPKFSKDMLKGALTFKESMFHYIKYKSFSKENNLINLPDCKEGLENKVLKEILNSNSFDSCVDNIKSKRYARTRLQRILTQYFVGFECFDTENLRKQSPNYARILGFNSKGKDILKKIKENSKIDIITKVPKYTDNPMLQLDIQATKMYSLINSDTRHNEDFLTSPIIIKH